MTDYRLAFKPAIELYGQHDPSAVLFEDGTPIFGVEEERYTREKHASDTFPEQAIRACLDHQNLNLPDLDRILLPYDPRLRGEIASHYVIDAIRAPGVGRKLSALERTLVTQLRSRFVPTRQIESRLESIDTPVPPIETIPPPLSRRERVPPVGVRRGRRPHCRREGRVRFDGRLARRQRGVDARTYLRTPEQPRDLLRDRHGVPRLPDVQRRGESDGSRPVRKLLEETVVDLAETAVEQLGTANVAIAGGVALNCKLNKRVRESPLVDDVFVQPVAHDAGLALGAGWAGQPPSAVDHQTDVYLGPKYETEEIRSILETNKLEYMEPDDLEQYVAERLADGDLVGWFQGRMEVGPRALGARSILADPRTAASRDRVNRFVKHREEWRPFAPSMLESAAEKYLIDGGPAPFMIDAYDVQPEKTDELEAVLHPADDSTRPQTVREDQHPRYHRLVSEFAGITGVPVVLNTSFNDHAEPIVRTPTQAIKDFYGMGLDILVLEDFVVEKDVTRPDRRSGLALPSGDALGSLQE